MEKAVSWSTLISPESNQDQPKITFLQSVFSSSSYQQKKIVDCPWSRSLDSLGSLFCQYDENKYMQWILVTFTDQKKLYLVNVKALRQIAQTFVAFSEKLNFEKYFIFYQLLWHMYKTKITNVWTTKSMK